VKQIVITWLLILISACNSFSGAQTGDTSKFIILSNLALDLDGSKHAYHPNNEGIDYNANGGINVTEATQNRFTGKRGYGIAKEISPDGKYYIGYLQPDGFFVSQTPVYNKQKPENDPARYADAETVPYVAMSPMWKKKGLKHGDIIYIVDLDNGKESAAIFGDARNDDSEFEISLALANTLGIPVGSKLVKSYDGKKTVKKYAGIKNHRLKIFYFTGSGDDNGKTPEEIQATGKKLMGKG
jgi:hypothetical protein